MDNWGMTIKMSDLPHAHALYQVGDDLYPRGVVGWLRRNIWWRLFPRRRRLLEHAVRRLTALVQQDLLNAIFDQAMQNLAARFGLEFCESGLDVTSGERELRYDRWSEQESA